MPITYRCHSFLARPQRFCSIFYRLTCTTFWMLDPLFLANFYGLFLCFLHCSLGSSVQSLADPSQVLLFIFQALPFASFFQLGFLDGFLDGFLGMQFFTVSTR